MLKNIQSDRDGYYARMSYDVTDVPKIAGLEAVS